MSDLSFHVKAFVPSATGEELVLREALLKARDFAAAQRAKVVNGWAIDLCCEAHECAGAFVFAEGVPLPRLKLAVNYCRHLVAAAFLAEHLDGELGR